MNKDPLHVKWFFQPIAGFSQFSGFIESSPNLFKNASSPVMVLPSTPFIPQSINDSDSGGAPAPCHCPCAGLPLVWHQSQTHFCSF